MPKFNTYVAESGREIAYVQGKGTGIGVIFFGGFMSDMEGTKALHLQQWCKTQNRPFMRFDYSGHGQSSGKFTDGCIGDWAADAQEVLTKLTKGPQIVVGSSMGGWIALLLAKRCPEKFAGLVTIAAAPDFTEDGFWASFNESARSALMEDGVLNVPSDYGEPYPITRRLIEDGRDHLVLRRPLDLPFPTHFLQGDCDEDVSTQTANQLFAHVTGENVQLSLIKGADHRFSDAPSLAILDRAVENMLGILPK